MRTRVWVYVRACVCVHVRACVRLRNCMYPNVAVDCDACCFCCFLTVAIFKATRRSVLEVGAIVNHYVGNKVKVRLCVFVCSFCVRPCVRVRERACVCLFLSCFCSFRAGPCVCVFVFVFCPSRPTWLGVLLVPQRARHLDVTAIDLNPQASY